MSRRVVFKSGYLKKVPQHGATVFNQPVKRWFVLSRMEGSLTLEYFDSEEGCVAGEPCTYRFVLGNCQPVFRGIGSDENFKIIMPERTLHLKAFTSAEADAWEAAINENARILRTPATENVYCLTGCANGVASTAAEQPNLYPDLGNAYDMDGDKSDKEDEYDMAEEKLRVALPPMELNGGKKDDTKERKESSMYIVESNLYEIEEAEERSTIPRRGRTSDTRSSSSSTYEQSLMSRPLPTPVPAPPPRSTIPPPPERVRESRQISYRRAPPVVNAAHEELSRVSRKLADQGEHEAVGQLQDRWRHVPQQSAVDELQEDVYDHLEEKLVQLGDWEALSDLRRKRNQSAKNVYKPNPDPPPFDWLAAPIELDSFHRSGQRSSFGTIRVNGEEALEARGSYKGPSPKRQASCPADTRTGVQRSVSALYITPGCGGDAYVNPLVGAVDALKAQILSPGGVVVRGKPDHLLNSVAFVEFKGCVWVAGWDRRVHRLHNMFHLGDQVMGVCEHEIFSLRSLNKAIQAVPPTGGPSCLLRLRRMPKANVLVVHREADGQSLGLKMDGGTNSILEVTPEGLLDAHGLPAYSRGLEGHRSLWTLTEVNNRSLNLFYKNSEVQVLLNAYGKDISLVVQPTDFVKQLRKELKKMRNYKHFILD